MDRAPAYKKNWVLTQDALATLLDFLDTDADAAGQKYESIRAKLVKFFQWRGCLTPDEYADRTIDRAARRLLEGAEMRVQDPYLYFHGIAVNILKEHWREPERDLLALDPRLSQPASSIHPDESQELERRQVLNERRLDCLDECMSGLPGESLDLITAYHAVGEVLSKNARKELAGRLGIPLNALRIRAFRIRTALEKCVNECLGRSISS